MLGAGVLEELLGYQEEKQCFKSLFFMNHVSGLHTPTPLITFLQPNEETLENEKAICSRILAISEVFLSRSKYRTDTAHGPETSLVGAKASPSVGALQSAFSDRSKRDAPCRRNLEGPRENRRRASFFPKGKIFVFFLKWKKKSLRFIFPLQKRRVHANSS